MELQVLALFELHDRVDLLVDQRCFAPEKPISVDKILLEFLDCWIIEILVISDLIKEELVIKKEPDKLVIAI
jgi:hypothetical protein